LVGEIKDSAQAIGMATQEIAAGNNDLWRSSRFFVVSAS